MTWCRSPARHRDALYEVLCARPIYRLIKSYTEPVNPRCEDFLYLIKRGVRPAGGLPAVLGRHVRFKAQPSCDLAVDGRDTPVVPV